MAAFLSTSCYGRKPLIEAIELCKKITPRNIEISAPHDYQPLEETAAILRKYKTEGISFTLHNYFPVPEKSFVLNIAADDEAGYNASSDLVKKALYLAKISDAPIYGIHAGYLSKAKANDKGYFEFDQEEVKYEKAFQKAVEFITGFAGEFKKSNISLIVENLFPSPKKRHSLNCTYEEISSFFDSVPNNIGFLLDLGHLNVSSNVLQFDRNKILDKILSNLSNRILEIHISENNGLKDDHMAVKENSWQLDAIKDIKEATKNNKKEVVYCVEARNADENELRKSINLVNNIIV